MATSGHGLMIGVSKLGYLVNTMAHKAIIEGCPEMMSYATQYFLINQICNPLKGHALHQKKKRHYPMISSITETGVGC